MYSGESRNLIFGETSETGFNVISDVTFVTYCFKKIGCPFVINASYPNSKNPENFVFINKIIDKHNHLLDVSIVEFELSPLIIEDIKVMTVFCKFGATAQRKFLEGKYPTHPVYMNFLMLFKLKFQTGLAR
uniref:Uncharacterized protein n=1 Tax=Rhizophagus irregularis (strain DAOM 181602 / DAOM 197198 / MUCL 43194) TaxID=747089 RepID=U9V8L1_RHIID